MSIEVPGEAGGTLHRLVVRDRGTHEVVLDLQTDERRFRLPLGDLQAGYTYLARFFVRDDAGWTALSPYWELSGEDGARRVSTADALDNLMEALFSPDPPEEAPEAILGFGAQAEQDPEHLPQLTRFVFRAWLGLGGPAGNAGGAALIDLARRSASMEGVSRHVRTALDYLALWAVAMRYFGDHGLRGTSYADLASRGDHLTALGEEIERCASGLSTTYGALMFAGMLTSVRDRAAAAKLFRAARAQNPEFASASGLDHFAATYLTEEDIAAGAGEIAERRAALEEGFEFIGQPPQGDGTGTLLLFSCSRTFFLIYFPFWASAIPYLSAHGVRMHFAFVGEAEEVAVAVEDGLAVAQAASRLRGLDPAALSEGLSFSRLAVPSYVGSTTTLYACARYLLARRLATSFEGRTLIPDMDMVIKGNPVDFLQCLGDPSQHRLPVAIARGTPSLIPTRRFMANTFSVPRGEFGNLAMQHVEDYMYAGISSQTSWALDQNALAFAVEQIVDAFGPDALVDLGRFERPFAQVPINKLYEAGQRKLDESLS